MVNRKRFGFGHTLRAGEVHAMAIERAVKNGWTGTGAQPAMDAKVVAEDVVDV